MATHSIGTFASIFAVALATALAVSAQTGSVALKSPNGELEIAIATVSGAAPSDAGGQLAYRVSFHGNLVVDWSNLGLDIQGSQVLGSQVRILSSDSSRGDETWSAPGGGAAIRLAPVR